MGGSRPEVAGSTGRRTPLLAVVLSRFRDRAVLVLIAGTAAIASALEAIVLVIITLAGFRLSGSGATPVDLPFGLPLDEISTGKLLWTGALALGLRLSATSVNLYLSARLSTSVLYRWRARVSDAFLRASWEEQRREQDGHLQTVSQVFIGKLSALVQQLSSALTALTSFLIFVVGAFALHPLAALGLLVFGGLLMLVLRPLTGKLRRLATTDKREGQEYARQLNELGSAATEIRTFGREREFEGRLDQRVRAQLAVRRHQLVLQGLTPQLFQVAGLGVVLLALYIASRLDLEDAVIVGALVLLLIRSLNYGQTFQSTSQAIAASGPFVEGVLEAIDRYERAALASGDRRVERLGSLELRDATLGYADQLVLDSVNLEIEAGEAIGLIGPSGAGKSTLGAALLDLLRPLSGSYVADGIEVPEIDRASWTRLVAFVPQEPRLFEGSVGENIDFHRGESEDAILLAAHSANLERELTEWPEGLKRDVGPRGARLSGGQKQRVCIARALLGQPEVLVLDEPTSALDNESEDSITDVLRDLRGTRTLIVIAHRLSTLEFCDRVLLVDKGRVLEIGTGADVQNRAELRQVAEKALLDASS